MDVFELDFCKCVFGRLNVGFIASLNFVLSLSHFLNLHNNMISQISLSD